MAGVDASRFESFLACAINDYPERERVFGGLPLFPTNGANMMRAFVAIRRLVKERSIDVLHSHHRFTSVVARIVAMTTGCRFTSTVHDLAAGGALMTRFGAASVVTVFSETVEKHLVNNFGFPRNRIQRIPMGISVSPPPGGRVRSGERTVVFVGRLDWEKGADVLLAAIPQILSEVREAVFCIAGTGDLERELRANAAAMGDHVRLLGWRDDVASLIGCADVAVVPSRREGFGRSVIEAMSLGVPVVASATGEIVNLIEDGVTGILVPPGDAEALAGAVVRVLLDQPLAERIGSEARARTAGKYSVAVMCAAVEQVYARLMAS